MFPSIFLGSLMKTSLGVILMPVLEIFSHHWQRWQHEGPVGRIYFLSQLMCSVPGWKAKQIQYIGVLWGKRSRDKFSHALQVLICRPVKQPWFTHAGKLRFGRCVCKGYNSIITQPAVQRCSETNQSEQKTPKWTEYSKYINSVMKTVIRTLALLKNEVNLR